MVHEGATVVVPHFPLWAFIAEMAAIPVAFIFLRPLLRRLRLVHPATWENLGRPFLFMWPWPGSIIGLLDQFDANIRLLVFPFGNQSFQFGNSGTATLLRLVRATLGMLAIFCVWSWWANP
jgi:hypothetical protein